MDFTLNQFVSRNPDNLLLEINADEHPQILKDPFFKISLVPTTFFFKDNKLWKKLEGSLELVSLEKYLQVL